MTHWQRSRRFASVGALGIGVHLATVAVLDRALGLSYLVASAGGVTAAILHNFTWHWWWTWADRRNHVRAISALVRFAAANGSVSLAGNLALMAVFVGGLRLPIEVGTVLAIAACGVANYWVSDTQVFVEHR